MLAWLRWGVASLVPVLFVALLVAARRRGERAWLVLATAGLGALGQVAAALLEERAAGWTGLDSRASASLLFVCGFAAPVREAAKVAAIWPAFQARRLREPVAGLVYASAAALGFAGAEAALTLRAHPTGWVWPVRLAVALPAHVFFAGAWGYALGWARRAKRPGGSFPLAWLLATGIHGLYAHLVFGRRPGALVGVLPLVAAMAVLALLALRELRARPGSDPASAPASMLEPLSMAVPLGPPSLRAVAEAMRREGQPVRGRWILAGVLVTLGAMTLGLAFSVGFGHWARVDFSTVDEHDVSTTAPVTLLGGGILLALPLSGYLIARASSRTTLFEPAVASGLAILLTLALLGLTAPVALVFALAFSPIAWALACAGAWVGRQGRRE